MSGKAYTKLIGFVGALVAAGVALIASVLSIAYSVFVAAVVRVGLCSWLLRFYRGEASCSLPLSGNICRRCG